MDKRPQGATGIPARGDFPGTAGFQARMPKGRCMGRALRPAFAADWKSALQNNAPPRRKVPRASLPVIFPR